MTEFDPRRCEHKQTELRFRPDVNGNPRYQHQCTDCGDPVGNFIRVAVVDKFTKREAVRPFDTALQSRMEGLGRKLSQEDREDRRDDYREYLKSEEWARKRQLVLNRAKGVCEGCGSARPTQVHHLTYAHVFKELLFELVALCDVCHEVAHE